MELLFQFDETNFNKSVACYKNAIPVISNIIEAYNRIGLEAFNAADLNTLFGDVKVFIYAKITALNLQEETVLNPDEYKILIVKADALKQYFVDTNINFNFSKMSDCYGLEGSLIILKDAFIESLREENKIYLTSDKQQKLNDFAQSFIESCNELGIESFNYNNGEFYFSMGIDDLDKHGLIAVLKKDNTEILQQETSQGLTLELAIDNI